MTADACERGGGALESEPDLEALYVRYHEFVRGALRKHYVDQRELEDMTQQVFLVLLRRVDEATEKQSISAWLYQIARRVAANHHRGERRRGRKHEDLEATHEAPSVARAVGDPEERYVRKQAWLFIREFLESLDEEACAVFVMSEIEGLRGVEIAARLRITLPMTYARIRSVRARFDRQLSRARTGMLAGLWGMLERPIAAGATFGIGLAARSKVLLAVLFLAVVGLLAARGSGGGSAAPEPLAPLAEADDDDRRSPWEDELDPDAIRRGRGAIGLFAGIVVDVDGAPIPGAIVCADKGEDHDHRLNDPPSCVTSDREGRFRIQHTLVRTHTLEAMARGFVPARYRGQPSDSLRLVLHPGGVELAGVVSDVHGGPIEGAWVSVENRSLGALGATATTDESGAFSLWVVEGTHSLAVGAEGYAATFEVALAPAKAVQIELSAESVIAGLVLDAATGAPQQGVRVEALLVPGPDRYANRGRIAFSDAEGRWEIRALQPNDYYIHAVGNRSWGRVPRPVDLGIGDRHDGIRIEMIDGAGIVGRIVEADTGEGCADGHVVTVDPAQGMTRGGVTDPDGHVEIEGLAGGAPYEVTVECRGYETRRFEVDLRDGPVPRAQWSLERGVELAVRVVDEADAPLSDWTVEIALPHDAQDATSFPPGHETTDAEGFARFFGLAPSMYRVVARGPGHPPIVAERFEARGEKSELELHAIAGVSVAGTVVGADGRPLASALVALQPPQGDPQMSWMEGAMRLDLAPDGAVHHAVTDDRGRFVHASVGPGEYGSKVDAGAHAADLVFASAGEVSGTVRGPDGAPVRGYALMVEGGRVEAPFAVGSADGRYVVGDLEAGRYKLLVSAPGGFGEAELELAAGEQRPGVDITLEPLAAVKGRLVDREGKPLGGWIAGARTARVDPTRPLDYVLIIKTSSDGTFVIRDLQSRELAIVATPVQPELLDPPQGPDFFATVPELRVVTPKGGETTDVGDVVVEVAR